MTLIDHANAVREESVRLSAAEREQRNQQIFREALVKYEKLASHQGNYRLLLDYCSGSLSMVAIDWLMTHMPKELALDFKDEKPALIDAIINARQWPNPTQERKRLMMQTRIWLIDELARLVSKTELEKLAAVELQAGLQKIREKESNFYFDSKGMRWPRLSRVIVPRGHVSACDTGEYLRHCLKFDTFEYRRLSSHYGPEQCDDIRLGRV